MDIAKYTGLFLIKNEYCYLPGIGSLQIIKKAARYDKDAQKMSAPEYTVSYRPGFGSIDDSFANFIANNERISIAHAANYLKDFCAQMKQQLQEGENVIIPAIGTFSMNKDQEIEFETDPHLNVQGKAVPVFQISPEAQQKKEDALTKIIENTNIREPKADEEIVIKPPKVNWAKITVLIVVILAIVGAGIYLINNLSRKAPRPAAEEQPAAKTVQPEKSAVTEAPAPVTEKPAATQSDYFMVAINQYQTLEDAASRVQRLNTYGNKTEVWTKDSSVYYVVIKVPATQDKQKAADSLKRFFNPGGKVEVVQ
ncbi:MAG TPA: HU family DNA-binding protein [Edaphocola sp.]|nr:HU family DNA-binding protein [Edaphocola sp.]